MQYITRAQWGARPPRYRNTMTSEEGIFVHHSAGPKSQTPRQIQNYHMDSRGWSDVAYSWLVDDNGTIYEGRGWGIAGGHTRGWNFRSHAVCYIGNTELYRPSEAALRGIKTVIDEHAKRYHGFVSPHRRVSSTACPGRELVNWLNAGMPLTGVPTTPTPPPSEGWHRPKPTLRYGSRGAEVWHLQASLRIWDPAIGVDGIFGPGTERTLKNFQRFWGLSVDGVYGPRTAAALDGALTLTGR